MFKKKEMVKKLKEAYLHDKSLELTKEQVQQLAQEEMDSKVNWYIVGLAVATVVAVLTSRFED